MTMPNGKLLRLMMNLRHNRIRMSADELEAAIDEIAWLLACDTDGRLAETCSEAPELTFRRLLKAGLL